MFLESPHRVHSALEDMVGIFGATRIGAIAKELTKVFETVHMDTLSNLHTWLGEHEERKKGEFVIVVSGAENADAGSQAEAHRALLQALLSELPLKTAVRLAATISGASRNRLYALALELSTDAKRGA